ncbi:MAG: OmpH family outer membrane protein [Myxococcales bacterium]|nr:OmpH family outer membrane protein [Myxococcales bacterium]
MHRAAYSLSAFLLIGALLPTPALAAKYKMAVVDMRKTMEQIPHWKEAYAKLEKERNARQLQIEAKKADLKKKRDALDAKKAVSDPKSVAAESQALDMELAGFLRAFQMSQQELMYLERQLSDQMLRRIEAVVQELSQEKNYDFVFESGFDGEPNVLYAGKGIDISALVVKRYAKHFEGKPLTDPKLPTPPPQR